MRTKAPLEQRLLQQSIIAAVVFACFSFVLGLLFRSQVILLDGLYSVISVVLSLSTLAALRFMRKADWKRFPYGKDTLEPLVVMIKFLALTALVLGSALAALITLFTGGRDVLVGPGLAYAVFAVAFCYCMYRYLQSRNRELDSNFVRTDISEWHLDTLVSGGVLAGFAIALGMAQSAALRPYVVYVDPVMVLALSVYFLRWPIERIRQSLRELLDMRPEGRLADDIDQVIAEIRNEYRLQESFVRISKVSKTLWLEIDFVVGPHGRAITVDQQDAVREELRRRIPRQGLNVWLTVAFTNDRKWAIE